MTRAAYLPIKHSIATPNVVTELPNRTTGEGATGPTPGFPSTTPSPASLFPSTTTHITYVNCSSCHTATPVNELTTVLGHGGWCWPCITLAQDADA